MYSRWLGWHGALFAGVLALACRPASAGDSPVGELDHIRVLVRDIGAARNSCLFGLGFVSPVAAPVIYPEGSAHDAAAFTAGGNFELFGIADRDGMMKSRPWMVEFLDRYEGAHSAGLKVASADASAARISAAGIEAPLFTLARKADAPPVRLVTPKFRHLPEGSVFFVQYPPRTTPLPDFPQPNTATELLSAWIVVSDVGKAGPELESIGFRRLREVASAVIGGSGVEYAADRGNVVLLSPPGSRDSPVAAFVRDRATGVMGFTIRVANLEAAKSHAAKHLGHEPAVATGWYGEVFFLPPAAACGAWLELTAVD